MKNIIKNNYGIEVNNINEIDNDYIFFYDDDKYILYNLLRPEKDLIDLYKISVEIFNLNLPINTIIKTHKEQLFININDQKYVLIKEITNDQQELFLNDIKNYTNHLEIKEQTDLQRNKWDKLWSEKVDYYEYQVNQIGQSKDVILNSFSYYAGLAENAISYANEASKKYTPTLLDKITLSHKRVLSPCLAKDYYNPLNFIFDLEIRDIAEYIKSAFFKKENIWPEIEDYFNNKTFTPYTYHMFYARLLYPSYYFDEYEKIINNEKDDSDLIDIISKVNLYEDFLADIYYFLLTFVNIEKIDWLIKKEL